MERIPTLQDASLVLQASVTKAASFDSAGLDMGEGYSPDLLGQPVAGIVEVTAIDLAQADETYTFKLQESSDNGVLDAFADVGVAVACTGTGIIMCKGFLTKRYARLVLTAAGTTPSITYAAWLRPFRLG